MNKSLDFKLRLEVFAMTRAADVLIAELEQRLVRADNVIDAESLRTSIKRVRAARHQVQMVA